MTDDGVKIALPHLPHERGPHDEGKRRQCRQVDSMKVYPSVSRKDSLRLLSSAAPRFTYTILFARMAKDADIHCICFYTSPLCVFIFFYCYADFDTTEDTQDTEIDCSTTQKRKWNV